jgi:hypothetical protein
VGGVLQRAAQSAPLPGSLSTLLQELAQANGIYLEAKVRFLNAATGGTKSTATYEYWEQGGRYRIKLSPGSDYPWSDVAFDGTFTQGKPAPDAVEIKRGDDRSIPLPDGPLALALAPLRVNDATFCRLCQLRLADLKKAVAWRRAASSTLASAESMIHQGTFDAGFGRLAEADSSGRLIRMVWPADEKQRHLDITLDNYQPIKGSAALFPMRLVESLTATLSVEYTVEQVDLSPSFKNTEVFNIRSAARKFFYTTTAKDGSVHTTVRSLQVAPPAVK